MSVPPPKLLRRAQSGDAESQYTLAAMYGAGDFLDKNDVEAVRWYRSAAEQGHAEAQRNLGLMYAYGEGVAQDFAECIHWIFKSANSGSIDAMKALATAYEHGMYGLEQDIVQAKMWLDRSAIKTATM